jgi:hypothetical protein
MPILHRWLVTLGLCPLVTLAVAGQAVPDVTIVGAFTAAYQATATHDTVVVGTEVQGIGDALEVRYAVSGGPTAIPERTVTVPLDDEAARTLARREGVRVLTALTLEPGDYTLTISVRGGQGQPLQTVTRDLAVPWIAAPSPITMSDVVMTSSTAGGFTHADVPDDHRMLPILAQPPSARREFSRIEKVEVAAEFYELQLPELEFGQEITVITRVRSTSGDVLWELKEGGTSETLSGGRFGYAHSTLIPVSTLVPGSYTVEVGAETLYEIPGRVSRLVPFTVVAPRTTP